MNRDLKDFLAGLPDSDESAVLEQLTALSGEEFRQLRVGTMAAREVVATFSIRSRTLKEAGIDASHLDHALASMRKLAPGATVQLHHFETGAHHLTVFASDQPKVLHGFVKVQQRDHR